MARRVHDVAVVGAGVVGAAIARSLSRYRIDVALVEAGSDVGAGTSKANTAIWHTGFDATPGTLEATLLRRSFPLMETYADEAGIPVERVGALLVAWTDEEVAELDRIARRAAANGVRVRRMDAAQVRRLEPNLGEGSREGLLIENEGIICPFTTPLAFATEAVANGVRLHLERPVHGAHEGPDGTQALEVPGEPIFTRWVVNAAGLFADSIDRHFVEGSFTVTPRRGELIVFDKFARSLVSHVILPVPTKMTKGVLVAPTVFGNVLLGPTAQDIDDKGDTGSTAGGISDLLDRGRRLVPRLLDEEVTAIYAGLRAATDERDYRIDAYPDRRYVRVAGIRSTGLSASAGIAEYVCELLADGGLTLEPKREFARIRMPNIGQLGLRPFEDEAAIARNPDLGRIVCHCERVTRGELVDACRSAVPARSIDGLRRRTRATLGRCQGFFCLAEVSTLLAHELARHDVDANRKSR